MTKRSVGLFLLISTLTTLLSTTLMFVAPLPARFLHVQFGRIPYWSFTFLSSLALAPWQPQWALFQFILLLAVGLFSDLEQLRVSTFYSAASSVFISSLSFVLLLSLWARSNGTRLVTILTEHLDAAMGMAKQSQALHLDTTYVMSLLPALLVIMLLFFIFISLVFIRSGRREPLTVFKAPDYLIWPLIITFAGAYLLKPEEYYYLQKFSSNALYIICAAYYFQGLAVLGFFFKRLRFNYFIKAALFFVFVFHLFLLVVLIGISDFWFSYRNKWYKSLMNKKTSRRQ